MRSKQYIVSFAFLEGTSLIKQRWTKDKHIAKKIGWFKIIEQFIAASAINGLLKPSSGSTVSAMRSTCNHNNGIESVNIVKSHTRLKWENGQK